MIWGKSGGITLVSGITYVQKYSILREEKYEGKHLLQQLRLCRDL
jgi:hypothetical protein